MHGLSQDIDLTFLEGRTLKEVVGNEHQVRIIFDDHVEISLECDCEVDGTILPLSKIPEALATMVGKEVEYSDYTRQGGVRITFASGMEVVFLDGNEEYESYNITWESGTIVV